MKINIVFFITIFLILFACSGPENSDSKSDTDNGSKPESKVKGELTYRGKYEIENPFSVVISPDGKHVYAASVTENSIVWYERNNLTGALNYINECISNSDLDTVYSVSISSDGKYVYAASLKWDSITWFERNSDTGDLKKVQSFQENGLFNHMAIITVSPDGKNLYAVNNWENKISIFNINNGNFENKRELLFDQKYRKQYDLPHIQVVITPDNKNLFLVGENCVLYYDRNLTTGNLSLNKSFDIKGASSVAVSPYDNLVYIIAEKSILQYFRNKTNGELIYSDKVSKMISSQNVNIDVINISPDGFYLYAAEKNYDGEDIISTFSAASLDLINSDKLISDVSSPRSMIVSPDGKHVYLITRSDFILYYSVNL